MAQDKSAEIIKFSGAGEPLQSAEPAIDEVQVDKAQAEAAPATLDDIGPGAFLREARSMANRTIEEVSAATKVKAEHIEAIEWMRPDRLPALPYATGFVKTYARYLGLDADAVAARFKIDAALAQPQASVAAAGAKALSSEPAGEGARLGSIFAMFAVALFAIWIGYQVIAGGGRSVETTQQASQQSNTITKPSPKPETRSVDKSTESARDDIVAAPALVVEESADNSVSESVLAPAENATRDATPAPIDANANNASVEEAPAEIITPPAAEEVVERALPRRVRPAPPPRQPVIVSAELTRSDPPNYPNRCTRDASAVETVSILFDVSAEGRATNARVRSSTNDCFESEAIRTVERWRFKARTVDGAPAVESGKTATVNFRK